LPIVNQTYYIGQSPGSRSLGPSNRETFKVFAGQLLSSSLQPEEKQLSGVVMYLPLTRIFTSALPISG
jgi:hypothetical protein